MMAMMTTSLLFYCLLATALTFPLSVDGFSFLPKPFTTNSVSSLAFVARRNRKGNTFLSASKSVYIDLDVSDIASSTPPKTERVKPKDDVNKNNSNTPSTTATTTTTTTSTVNKNKSRSEVEEATTKEGGKNKKEKEKKQNTPKESQDATKSKKKANNPVQNKSKPAVEDATTKEGGKNNNKNNKKEKEKKPQADPTKPKTKANDPVRPTSPEKTTPRGKRKAGDSATTPATIETAKGSGTGNAAFSPVALATVGIGGFSAVRFQLEKGKDDREAKQQKIGGSKKKRTTASKKGRANAGSPTKKAFAFGGKKATTLQKPTVSKKKGRATAGSSKKSVSKPSNSKGKGIDSPGKRVGASQKPLLVGGWVALALAAAFALVSNRDTEVRSPQTVVIERPARVENKKATSIDDNTGATEKSREDEIKAQKAAKAVAEKEEATKQRVDKEKQTAPKLSEAQAAAKVAKPKAEEIKKEEQASITKNAPIEKPPVAVKALATADNDSSVASRTPKITAPVVVGGGLTALLFYNQALEEDIEIDEKKKKENEGEVDANMEAEGDTEDGEEVSDTADENEKIEDADKGKDEIEEKRDEGGESQE